MKQYGEGRNVKRMICALMLLAAISWPVMQEIHSALTKAPEVLR